MHRQEPNHSSPGAYPHDPACELPPLPPSLWMLASAAPLRLPPGGEPLALQVAPPCGRPDVCPAKHTWKARSHLGQLSHPDHDRPRACRRHSDPLRT
eukprot:5096031-Prymnesium_polylepis.2